MHSDLVNVILTAIPLAAVLILGFIRLNTGKRSYSNESDIREVIITSTNQLTGSILLAAVLIAAYV